ncbi:MAG TPA: molybdenum ABC transporter ATP-binding protein [Amaricoccus sp.]|uniref:molybdenum ABC transporter ATP-binding protein n=1 Tax=Amaricoccus sp. TaxID=1872485 RepID=UPI002CC3DBE0|nr:molybdenum ABC transporter ATP-binding protein [Amaricoccus sp.]HMQ93193.1 molybdenum ABC transporter ATP-binding protein [Amaricoccus sp.]HMR54326.1 molybdenum ABC transporter ATP-binding protein [Amaricoccus sp.]HMR60471.1 molybdenum ABC transporter ATP-binding protein [Amaricoccus sp.]HMU01317.1 molybdenum ABC transporter ATP-binding protein [Amaricoccus sp.]
MLHVAIRHAFASFTLDAEFRAPPGVTVLFGRSGSGKTTIVNAVAGLLMPDQGLIASGDWTLLDTARGVRVKPHHRRIGYIFQEGRLFPHLTVRQNLAYGAWMAPKGAAREDMGRIAELLGIGHLLGRRPGVLSGGEKQRVAIGRALLSAPRLVLADEPLASLDEARKAEILPYFERLRDEVSVPMLYVSHSASEVARLATTVVALDGGRVVAQGPAAEVLGDPSVLPAGVRAVGAVLTVRVAHHHDDGLTELEAGGLPLFLPRVAQATGSTLRVRIAAHDVILSRTRPEGLSALNILPGIVREVRPSDGPGAIVALNTAAGRVLAHITRRSADALGLAEGVEMHAVVKTVSVAPSNIGAGGQPR